MTDRYDALERLQKLRESGVLTEEEFSSEKARILGSDVAAAPSDASPIAMSPTPVGEQAMADQGEASSSPWRVPLIILAILLFLGAAGWFGFRVTEDGPNAVANPKGNIAETKIEEPESPNLSLLPEDDQLKLAFKAVTGVDGGEQVTKTKDDETKTTVAVKLLRLQFGPVLLTSTTIEDGCHACEGSMSVYYLAEEEGAFKAKKHFADFIPGQGFGAPPKWIISEKFTDYPAVFTTTGYTGQGYVCSGSHIVELRPEGPVLSDYIHTGVSNEGAIDPETGLTGSGEEVHNLEGKITNIIKGKSFTVKATGEDEFEESYVRKGGKFVPLSVETKLGC